MIKLTNKFCSVSRSPAIVIVVGQEQLKEKRTGDTKDAKKII